MKPIDDMLPGEREEQHAELITLLQRAYRKSVRVTPTEQAQIITRARERLMKTHQVSSLHEEMPVQQVGLVDSPPRKSGASATTTRRGRRILHLINILAAALVVGIIISASLLLFSRQHLSTVESPAEPLVVHAEAGGLEVSMQITPGPYFLSELLAVDLSLTNHTQTTFTLAGPSGAGPCGAALFLAMTGGVAPDYTLPVSAEHSCPRMQTQLKPEETLTFHHFIPLSSSGDITLKPGAQFLHTQVDPNGGQSITAGPSPLDGHWPSIKIHVASRVPIDRKISLQQEGTQVQINAPAAARTHLYYIYNVTCDAFQGGTVGTGNYAWEPISTTILHEPGCGDYGNQNIHWYYAVSAPGYAIVAGHYPS